MSAYIHTYIPGSCCVSLWTLTVPTGSDRFSFAEKKTKNWCTVLFILGIGSWRFSVSRDTDSKRGFLQFFRRDLSMSTVVERGFIVLSILTAIGQAIELKDYCSMHKFDNLPGGLRFTKEVVTTEYANIGAFKALHCCLRGYRSIEW